MQTRKITKIKKKKNNNFSNTYEAFPKEQLLGQVYKFIPSDAVTSLEVWECQGPGFLV